MKAYLQSSHIIEIIDKIYIGSYWNTKDEKENQNKIIKIYFKLTQNIITFLKTKLNIKNDFPTEDFFEKSVQFIHESLLYNDGNILIYCMKGKSRSATINGLFN